MWPFNRSCVTKAQEVEICTAIQKYKNLVSERTKRQLDGENYSFDPEEGLRILQARKDVEGELWKLKQGDAKTLALWCMLWAATMWESDFDSNRAAESFARLRKVDTKAFGVAMVGWQWAFVKYFGHSQPDGPPLVPVDVPQNPKNFIKLVDGRP
jgi:hypothetical protein